MRGAQERFKAEEALHSERAFTQLLQGRLETLTAHAIQLADSREHEVCVVFWFVMLYVCSMACMLQNIQARKRLAQIAKYPLRLM